MCATIVKLLRSGTTAVKTLKPLLRPCLVYRTKYNFSTSCSWRGRVYSEKHEWAEVDGKIAKIGISDYAQEALGDVVFVQLPEVGQQVNKDDDVGAVESVKAASDVYTPLTGIVRETNKKLEEKPGLINTACYTEGWLFTLEFTKPEELKELMDEQQYHDYLKKAKQS